MAHEHECPVCLQLLRPPILFTCGTTDLHKVCGVCLEQLQEHRSRRAPACPLCRAPLMATPGRAHGAEQEIGRLGHALDCRVCGEAVPYADYASHTEACDKVYHCPLDDVKVATLEELDEHVTQAHGAHAFRGPLEGDDPEVADVTPMFTDATWRALAEPRDEEPRDEERPPPPLRALCQFDDERVLVEFRCSDADGRDSTAPAAPRAPSLHVQCTWVRSVRRAAPSSKSVSVQFRYSDYAVPVATERVDAKHVNRCRAGEPTALTFDVPFYFQSYPSRVPAVGVHHVLVLLRSFPESQEEYDEEGEDEGEEDDEEV